MLALTLLLGACRRDAAQPQPGGAEAMRQGIVTVSAEQAAGYDLNWVPPTVDIVGVAPDALIKRIKRAQAQDRLFADSNAMVPLLLALLRTHPADAEALALRSQAIDALLARGEAALARNAAGWPGAAAEAHQIAAVARVVDAADPRVQDWLARLDASDRLDALLLLGERDLAEDRLGEDGIGARADFGEVLRNRPDDVRARDGLRRTQEAMVANAFHAADVHDYGNVLKWMRAAESVAAEPAAVHAAWARIEAQRLQQVQRMYADARILLQDPHGRRALSDASALLREIERVAVPSDGLLQDLRAQITRATHYGPFAPGQTVREALRGGGFAPELVVIPHGAFTMGAAEDEPGSTKAERPAHRVVFARGVAIGVHEVSVGEYAAFVRATQWITRAERRGHSLVYDERSGNFARRSGVNWRHDYTGRLAAPGLPVLHLDMRDVDAYTEWLSEQTGRRYRLPSEAEFEYALRAGGHGRFPWGDGGPPAGAGNLTGALDVSPSGRRWANAFAGYGDGFWGPAPRGHDRANAFGLHDMAGNVGEWVADCWHQGYRRAPAEGAAWLNPGCRSRVVRGGSWAGAPDQVRSAWRMPQTHDTTNARTGFRIARDI